MSLQVSINFNLRDRQKLEVAHLELSDDEVVLLREYLAEALKLEEAMKRQGGFAASYKVSWEIGQPLRIGGTEPDIDQRAVVLHRLRPFILERERLAFNKIRGVVTRATKSPELHEWLGATKTRYTGKLLQKDLVVTIGDVIVNSEKTLDAWLNAFEYHRDEEKAIALIKAHDPFPIDSSRPIFIMMLREKALAVLHVGWVVNQILTAPLRDLPDVEQSGT